MGGKVTLDLQVDTHVAPEVLRVRDLSWWFHKMHEDVRVMAHCAGAMEALHRGEVGIAIASCNRAVAVMEEKL